ncbi:C2H2 finger domain protein, putative [Beauveria bassiana ARSEF 2860]|uniref:C2H2 finger domain protein, putative n=1 Tax=Beauveria bassiana (strain ARSEF 2860) TaxID=655819 RepID=J4UG36_BEAB2|nr:C2H2 finger domain protein, putative [Beauveria bassiana ARSEF 2860]EJP61692.1 C2H2 finger domain protein, putative [Beauveria bassiana ARSEF 2860]
MSDNESYTDELFDREDVGISDAETDLTSTNLSRDGNFDAEKAIECDDADIEDLGHLFGGNALPPDYYQSTVEDFNDDKFRSRNYSEGTKILKLICENLWREFCTKVLQRDAQKCFECIHEEFSIRLPYKFLEWRLNQKVGKDGRRLKGVQKFSSLDTYWKVFRLAFQDAVGEKLDHRLGHSMQNALRKLAEQYKLSYEKRMNRCMSIEDLKEQNQTTIATTEKTFKLGEMRVLAVLYTLLLSPAGARPMSILKMTFGDLSFAKARDPEGGPAQILIRFSLRFTKTWLGPKATKTHPLPEHFLGSSFLLSTHVFLLGLIFHHRAFRAPDLTSPEQLDLLEIHPGERELSLPLKKDIQGVFLFRKIIKTVTGYEMSAEQIPYSVVSRMLRIIGEILGREHPTISYSLRYNAGNALDRSPHVSDALRNLILGHAESRTFQNHYLGREIAVDTSAIVQGLEPKQSMMIQATSLGHSASKRRPRHLTDEQLREINSHPAVVRLQKEVQQHVRGSEECSKAIKELGKVKFRLRNEERDKMRDEWTAEQAVDDIQRQLHGIGFKPPAENASTTSQGQEQKRLTEALNVPPSKKVEEYFPQRNEAISAIMAYCRVYEGPPSQRHRAEPVEPIQQANDVGSKNETLKDVLLKSVMVDDAVKRPRKCFVCCGNALRRDFNDSGFLTLTADFYSSSDLNKHFRRFHLQNLQEGQTIECPACSVLLEHKQEFLTHAQVVHGIHLRVGNSYEADSQKRNGGIGCDNDRRGRKREAESSTLVAQDHSRNSRNSANHTDRSSHNTNKRQRLDCDPPREVRSISRRDNEQRGRKRQAEKWTPTTQNDSLGPTTSARRTDRSGHRANKRQRLDCDPPREVRSISRRTEHDVKSCPATTEANDVDDGNNRLSKRQKRTSYLAPKALQPKFMEGDSHTVLSDDSLARSSRHPSKRASMDENRPNPRRRTVGRPRAGLTRREFSHADTENPIEATSDSDRARAARRYQPSISLSTESSDYDTRRATTGNSTMPDPVQTKGGRTRMAFTHEQNTFLIQLRNTELAGRRLSWTEIHQRFCKKYPERSKNTLQVHYSTKLRSVAKSWANINGEGSKQVALFWLLQTFEVSLQQTTVGGTEQKLGVGELMNEKVAMPGRCNQWDRLDASASDGRKVIASYSDLRELRASHSFGEYSSEKWLLQAIILPITIDVVLPKRLGVAPGGSAWLREAPFGSGRLPVAHGMLSVAQGGSWGLREGSWGLSETELQYLSEARPLRSVGAMPKLEAAWASGIIERECPSQFGMKLSFRQ